MNPNGSIWPREKVHHDVDVWTIPSFFLLIQYHSMTDNDSKTPESHVY
jgi:hypothetical protein